MFVVQHSVTLQHRVLLCTAQYSLSISYWAYQNGMRKPTIWIWKGEKNPTFNRVWKKKKVCMFVIHVLLGKSMHMPHLKLARSFRKKPTVHQCENSLWANMLSNTAVRETQFRCLSPCFSGWKLLWRGSNGSDWLDTCSRWGPHWLMSSLLFTS